MNHPTNIAVIEDQKYIRQGTIAMLNQIGQLYDLHIEEYQNAEDVLANPDNTNLDIMLVDIVLEEISGLELIKKLRNIGYLGQFVIISSYEKFEYAQQALENDVSYYLVKPIKYSDLYRVITHLIEKINHQKANFEQLEHMKYTYAVSLLINKLEQLDNTYSESQLFDKMGIHFSYDNFMISAVSCNDSNHLDDFFFYLKNKLKTYQINCIRFPLMSSSKYIFLFNMNKNNEGIFTQIIKETLYTVFHKIYCGVSSIVIGLDHISQAYAQAKSALEECVFKNLCFVQYFSKEANTCSVFSSKDYEMLNSIIKKNDKQQLSDMLNAIFNKQDLIHFSKDQLVKELLNIINYFQQSAIVCGIQKPDMPDSEKIASILRNCNSIFQIKIKTREILSNIIDNQKSDYPNYIVNYILLYIEKNYHKKVSLQTISEELNISYHYASTIFSQKRGVCFSEYLLTYRLNEAAKLLRNTSKHIYQVSSDCGFYDSQMFSKSFKKYYGLTPKEFRNRYYSEN